MNKKIFIDANVLLDHIDTSRNHHTTSKLALEFLLKNHYQLYTSCDLITTIYYVLAKKDKKMALQKIKAINTFCTVVEFANKEVAETCDLMEADADYIDLEDTMQYILSRKNHCETIISNDKNFVAKDIWLTSSQDFCKDHGL